MSRENGCTSFSRRGFLMILFLAVIWAPCVASAIVLASHISTSGQGSWDDVWSPSKQRNVLGMDP